MASRLSPHPYAFAPGVHERRHGPAGWSDYARYRPWLRDEFSFRCTYCLHRERWADMRRAFQIDHFVAQSIRPDLRATYDNLLYLCAACNNLKRASALPDPCEIALDQCLRFLDDGSVEAISPHVSEGELLIEILQLDQPELVEFRRIKIGTIKSHAVHNRDLYLHEMGYPTLLPDLGADSPPANSRSEGLTESCYFRRNNGTLPEVY